MKIKRFNENQSYLTDPIDPEFELFVSVDSFVKKLKIQLEGLAKKLYLGLTYLERENEIKKFEMIENIFIMMFKNRKRSLALKIDFNHNNNRLYLGVDFENDVIDIEHLWDDNGANFQTIEELEEYLKHYFELDEN